MSGFKQASHASPVMINIITISAVYAAAPFRAARLSQTANIKWRFGREWPKECLSHSNTSGHAAAHPPDGSFEPFGFEALFVIPAPDVNQGQPSRDILIHQSAAHPSPGGAKL
jgi:hypothetical protein